MTVTNVRRVIPGLLDQLGNNKPNGASESTSGAGFAEQLGNLLKATNDAQIDSAELQQALMNGEPVELHQVMIKAEEAGLTLDLLLEIRNKLVSAYKDLVRMPM